MSHREDTGAVDSLQVYVKVSILLKAYICTGSNLDFSVLDWCVLVLSLSWITNIDPLPCLCLSFLQIPLRSGQLAV